jgi:hypothetical protein
MSLLQEVDPRLVDYLLGRLPDAERVELEGRLFADAELDEQLVATTDDLIQAYLTGVLSEDDRRRFESHFLAAPDHRERLVVMKHLLATRAPAIARPWRAWALAALLVLALASLTFLLLRPAPLGEQRAEVSPPVPAPPEVSAPSPSVPPRQQAATASDTIRIVRLPRTTARAVAVELAPDTRVVRLQVPVNDRSPSFDVSVRNADGREVWRAEGVTSPAGQPLDLEVPVTVMASGAYTLRVEGEALRDEEPPVLEYRLQVGRTITPH